MRGLLRSVALGRADTSQAIAWLEVPNLPSTLPEACGHPIAAGWSAGWKCGENRLLAAATRSQREFDAVLAEVIDWERRSLDKTPLETFIRAGISYLSTSAT